MRKKYEMAQKKLHKRRSVRTEHTLVFRWQHKREDFLYKKNFDGWCREKLEKIRIGPRFSKM